MQNNIERQNMTTKKITLNSDKRKVIADQFQSFYEDKVKDKLVQAKEQYDLIRAVSYTHLTLPTKRIV